MSVLFKPYTIGSITIPNRIVFLPITTGYGHYSIRYREHIVRRAQGGVGLVIVDDTHLYEFSSGQFLDTMPQLVKEVHEKGAVISIQINVSFKNGAGESIDVSATKGRKEASLGDLKKLKIQYGIAALAAKRCGFDMVEINGSHMVFLSHFFTIHHNNRNDRYGISLENRMRFGLEVLHEVRNAVGHDFPVSYRHSMKDFKEGGASVEDSIKFVEELKKESISLLNVTAGYATVSPRRFIPGPDDPEGTFSGFACRAHSASGLPTIAVGRLQTPSIAEKIINSGMSPFVGLGRQLIADPDWPLKIRDGKTNEIVNCIWCNRCFARPIRCTVNPNAGIH